MAKGEAKRIQRESSEESRRINRESDAILNLLRGRLPQAAERGNRTYDTALRGYSDVLDRPRSGGFGNYESAFKRFGESGGVDPESRSRIRGSGVFDEFAKTGGLSTEDVANLRARGTRTIPSFFSGLRDRMSQLSAASGGAGPGFTTSLARIAREQARASQDAATDVETGLIDTRNRGRMFGAEGISGSERSLADLVSSNRRFGLEGGLRAAGMGAENEFRDRALDMDAISGIRGLRTDLPAEEMAFLSALMEGTGQRGQLAGNMLGRRMEYSPNRGLFDYLMPIWGQVSQNIAQSQRRR